MQTTPRRRDSKGRRPSFCISTNAPEDGTSFLPLVGKHTAEQTWNPNEADPFAQKSTGTHAGNVIDRRTLYSIRRENIASRELGFLNRPPTQGEQTRVQNNIEHLVEKNYIMNSRLTNATPEIFPRVIMKHFFRISAPGQTLGYGMPRPDTRETNQFKRMMEGLQREPSLVRLDNYPDLQMPVTCDRTSEFCEILGPSSCSICIENTNRHIGTELQHMLFPTIDMSMKKLILPNLAQVLREGHRHQVRKRRMHELGLDIPQELLFMKREEHPMSSKTCMNCKKKINVKPAKIEITLPSGKSTMPSIYSGERSSKSKRKNKCNTSVKP